MPSDDDLDAQTTSAHRLTETSGHGVGLTISCDPMHRQGGDLDFEPVESGGSAWKVKDDLTLRPVAHDGPTVAGRLSASSYSFDGTDESHWVVSWKQSNRLLD